MKRIGWLFAFIACSGFAVEPEQIQRRKVPPLPSAQGDERGMANQIGPATYQRCAWHMQQPGAKAYELSHLRSNTMPLSPFAGPYAVKPEASAGIPGTAHLFNTETFNQGAQPAQQGTQMDALGHFGAFKQPWDGKSEFPADQAVYYGGFTQKDVKPTPDSRFSSSASRRRRRSSRARCCSTQRPTRKKPWKRASS